jgi:MFS family permease
LTAPAAGPAAQPAPAWTWFFLSIPFGATSGYPMVALGWLATQAGMGDEVVAAIVAATLLPQWLKFLWAPLCDVISTRKRWYLASNVVSSLTLALIGFVPFRPDLLWVLKGLVLVNSIAISFNGMCVQALMAEGTPPARLGLASGWHQAGNLGGAGLGGGLALVLSQHLSPGLASLTTGALLLACGVFLRAVPEGPRPGSPGDHRVAALLTGVKEVALDLWSVLASKSGIFALTLCFVPLGSGAAQGLFSAIAERWGASADLVAATTGSLGGAASAAGCLLGGWLSDRMNRKIAYAMTGLLLAAAGAAMASSPHTPFFYGLWTLGYAFALGVCYGAFTGFALEVVGQGAVATKYSALASLSNFPTWYMTLVLGWVSASRDATWMLLTDAGAGLAGAAVLLGLLALFGKAASGVGAAET